MGNQLSIFDVLYPKYKITKPIKLIEFFAGYGSQALALKYLGVNFEHHKTCEWAVKSIQAYKDIHFTNDTCEVNLSKDELVDKLFNLGISSNYNEPMTFEQIKRINEKELKNIYSNILINHNLVNIQKAKGIDLEITDKGNYEYLLTYSFPCQDLSLAGNRKGMNDNSTRSGMLWEVERILKECYDLNQLPQILLMENVPQVHSSDNAKDFHKWQVSLEQMGYKNYMQDLIATDYGIPQTRNRTFMISILGEYSYNFPKPIPLELKLKDLLEEEVDEKYYLSDKMLDYMYGTNAKDNKFPRGERFKDSLKKVENGIANTITTCAGNRPTDNFITIPEDTQKGYAEAYDGDGVYINRPHQKRGVVQKDKIQTLKTNQDVGVVVLGYYTPSKHEASRIISEKYSAPTVKENHGTVTAVQTNLKIRKLTPKECFRLMGVKDEDFENCAKNQSNSSLYHLAGDSIVVNVLMATFNELF